MLLLKGFLAVSDLTYPEITFFFLLKALQGLDSMLLHRLVL